MLWMLVGSSGNADNYWFKNTHTAWTEERGTIFVGSLGIVSIHGFQELKEQQNWSENIRAKAEKLNLTSREHLATMNWRMTVRTKSPVIAYFCTYNIMYGITVFNWKIWTKETRAWNRNFIPSDSLSMNWFVDNHGLLAVWLQLPAGIACSSYSHCYVFNCSIV